MLISVGMFEWEKEEEEERNQTKDVRKDTKDEKGGKQEQE